MEILTYLSGSGGPGLHFQDSVEWPCLPRERILGLHVGKNEKRKVPKQVPSSPFTGSELSLHDLTTPSKAPSLKALQWGQVYHT